MKEKECHDACCAKENMGKTDTCQKDCCTKKKSQKSSHSESAACHDDCCHDEEMGEDDCCEEEDIESGESRTYEVVGMDCGACALTIEKGVKKMVGVHSATVNFSTGKMQIVAEQSVWSVLPNTVKQLGYQLVESTVATANIDYLKVEGMDCGGCARTIEKHLTQVEGVQKVAVSFANGSMTITHTNPLRVILTELEKIGYHGIAEKSASQPMTAEKSMDTMMRQLALSGGFLLLGYIAQFGFKQTVIGTIFFAVSMVISGYKPARSAFYAIKSKSLDMNVLMVAAAIGAALIGEWNEGALVVYLFSIGNVLQNKAVEKTRRSLKGLLALTPDTALVKKENQFVKVILTQVKQQDILLIKAGERIPLDGSVVKGRSTVDQAPITGESIPVEKEVGSEVFAGTLNQEGALEVQVSRLANESTIAKIITMVETAQAKKAPTEAFIDTFAKIYTPIVFLFALGLMLVPPVFFQASFSEWFYKGLELLVIACPCALIISTPVSIVSAIGNAAKNGVLIKGGAFLEKAGTITALAFDKTGTITAGKPEVSVVYTYSGTEQEMIQKLAALEGQTTHPIGQAIVAYNERLGNQPQLVSAFKTIPGKGITGNIASTTYLVGSEKLFSFVFSKEIKQQAETLQTTGHSIVFIGTRERIIGLVGVADTIRETSHQALHALENLGIRETVMLTGDNRGAAEKIAAKAGVRTVKANLLPADKVAAIEELKQTEIVGMVGDGINDAPALAAADIGIAMGGAGSDTAIETADIVLMADNLEKLPYTLKLSKRTLAIIKQNIAFSLIIKVIALLFVFPGWLTLWAAVLSDSGAAVLVTLNALRLAGTKKQ